MGAFFTNYQVRTDSAVRVREVLAGLVQSRAYVSNPKNGWVTVYDEASDEQDDAVLRRVATGLSQALKTAVLAFLVHDSDIAAYWLYRDGKLVDEFNSAPDYFKKVNDKARARLRGNTDALLPLCVAGTTREQIDAVLHAPEGAPVMAEELVADLAPLLGIDKSRVTLGFGYFQDEGAGLLPDIAEFEPVGEGAERKTAKAPSPADQRPLPQPDLFAMAVGMLVQPWGAKSQIDPRLMAMLPAKSAEAMVKKLQTSFDRGVRETLKHLNLPDLPTFEELTAARDQDPDALAELLSQRAPDRLTDIGVSAAIGGAEQFVAALLERGLDPNASDSRGMTPLAAAERHGKTSPIYQLLKSASDRRG